jgi:hypothetical protein
MVNNGNYAVIGNSSTNSCSFTTIATSYVIGGVSINNYSVPVILATFTNTYAAPTSTVTIPFTVSGQNNTVLILLSSGEQIEENH